MAKLLSINAPTIEVKNVGIFVDKIQSPGIQICRVDWRNAGDDNCFIFFDDKQTVQIVESEYLPTNTCLEIEVENLNSLHALLNKNGIDYIDEDETSFFIENIYFKAKETSTPHVIEFEFNGNKYTIDKNSSVIAKRSNLILLPDGRALKIEKWTDTIPPQPCEFTNLEIAQASLVAEKNDNSIFDESVNKMQNFIANEDWQMEARKRAKEGRIFSPPEERPSTSYIFDPEDKP